MEQRQSCKEARDLEQQNETRAAATPGLTAQAGWVGYRPSLLGLCELFCVHGGLAFHEEVRDLVCHLPERLPGGGDAHTSPTRGSCRTMWGLSRIQGLSLGISSETEAPGNQVQLSPSDERREGGVHGQMVSQSHSMGESPT